MTINTGRNLFSRTNSNDCTTVATCRQILDRHLAASLLRVILKRLETSEWAALADTLMVLNTLLAERTAPFRPTRQRLAPESPTQHDHRHDQQQTVGLVGKLTTKLPRYRFQGVFIETETEVSEAAGRSTATGLDALVDVLNQAIHPLAPYAIAAIFLICEDNGASPSFFFFPALRCAN